MKLNECEIPDVDIGDGATLHDLQYVNLYEDWEAGLQRIVNVMQSASAPQTPQGANAPEDEVSACVLLRSEDGVPYFIPFQKVLWDATEISLTLVPASSIFDQMLLEAQIRGELSSQYGNRLQALSSPIPELYQHFRDTPQRFQKFARLMSVLYLKLSNTVEDILQLDIELLNSAELQIKFRGQRSPSDVNEDPIFLEFEGVCPLPK